MKKTIIKTDIKTIKIEQLVLLKVNANFMDKKTLDRLTENIKKDGQLTQLPFVHPIGKEKFEVISGNHRIMAAKKAGLKKVRCICSLKKLDNDTKLRIQISHNSIRGSQTQDILLELANQIIDPADLFLAGVDLEANNTPEIDFDSLAVDIGGLEMYEVSILFTSFRFKQFMVFLDKIKNIIKQKDLILLERKQYGDFIKQVSAVKKELNIKSNGVVFSIIIDYIKDNFDNFLEYLEERGKKNKHVKNKKD